MLRLVHTEAAPLAEAPYSYLIGTYLGDGHITTPSPTTAVLAIYCSDDWPGVSAETGRANPGHLLRGLFHSDGCRNVNWTQKRTEAGLVRYAYPKYFFSNRSEDILAICEAALDSPDIAHRRPRPDLLSVARRASVARLDELVGPKY